MFVLSLKLSKRKKAVLCTLAVVAVVATFAFVRAQNPKDVAEARTASTKITGVKAPDNAQRLEFLGQFGWEVKEEPCEVVEVQVPDEFDDVFKNYNEIQKKQGFDLERYHGKKMKRYTYEVTNYPDQPDGIRANLLIYQNKIVGGDICSLQANGFMHGFEKV